MNITSPWFVTLTIVLAVVAFCVALFIVPRRRTGGVLKYVEQFFALTLTTVLVLFALGIYLNSQNNWYTNTDVFFAENQDPTVQNFGDQQQDVVKGAVQHGTPNSIQKDPHSNPLFGSQIPADTSKGAYVTFNLAGNKTGKTVKTMVWLPPSYFTDSTRIFPVIVGFAGFPGTLDTYSKTLDYGGRIMNAVHQKNMQEAIFAVPDVSPGTYDSECVDGNGANAPQVESFVTQDLVPWIENNLRTINDASAWATTGYSAGGYCAALFPIKHPDFFGNGLVQSGYFNPVYSDNQQWNDPQDPHYRLAEVATHTKPNVGIYFYGAKDDTLAMQDLDEFSHAVASPTVFELVTVPYGGHTADVWEPGINSGLAWLGHRSSAFAA